MTAHPCDRQRIDVFLREEITGVDNELTRHLEICQDCRDYLDSQAAPPEQWLEVRRLLQRTDFDVASTGECSAGGLNDRISLAPPSIQAVLDLLSPSDDPHRLGRLGVYEISGVVGVGGMGVVLKAVDPSLDRVVAIKVLAPHLANNATARKRFAREAKAIAAVLHPNVIPIHCVSSDGVVPYLVMAYIRGGSLQKRLDREGPLPTVEILRIGAQVAAGLAAAHDQGLVHRDIKPENILLEEGVERVTLTDFGLARTVDDATVTREGTIAGTPQYMSPEQARGGPIDQKSDLFSLGSVLYTLCTGRPPFRADSSYAILHQINDESPVPIRELNPDIPDWLADIIDKLMSKQPSNRFASANEVHTLLEACLSHVQHPTSVPLPALSLAQATRTRRLPRRRLLVAAGLTGFVLLVAAAFLSIQTKKTTLQFTIDDPAITVGFSGQMIRADSSESEAFGVEPATEQTFVVFRNGMMCETNSLTLRRGQQVTLGVSVVDDKIVITPSDRNVQLALTNAKPVKDPQGERAIADQQGIQGTWQVTYSEINGQVSPQEVLKDLRFVFTDDRLVTEALGRKTLATFKLDPSTTPKSIDVVANRRMKSGIYDLQGDTLRICLAEGRSGRPIAFDLQPNSPNDVFIMLKRVRSGPEQAPAAQELDRLGSLTAEAARVLIPQAASMSSEDFEALSTAGPDSIDNKSLSLIMLSLDVSRDIPSLEQDFQFLVDGVPRPADLAAAMSLSKSKGYVSMIQPEYITDCQIWGPSTHGRARGYVSFKVPLLYTGSAIFEAGQYRGEWRIDKFHLQNRRITIVLGDDGKWKREERRPDYGALIAFEIRSERASGIAFSSDSLLLAETTQRGVRIWSMEGKLVKEFLTDTPVCAPEFSPDGSDIFAAEAKEQNAQPGPRLSTIRRWNLNTGRETMLGDCRGMVTDLQISPDGQRLAVAAYDEPVDMTAVEHGVPRSVGFITIWDTVESDRIAEIDCGDLETQLFPTSHSQSFVHNRFSIPEHLRFSWDGARLAVAFRTGLAVVLDGHQGRYERMFDGDGGVVDFEQNGRVTSASVTIDSEGMVVDQRPAMRWRSKAGRHALSMPSSGQIQVHDLLAPDYFQMLPQPDTPNPLLAVSPSGSYVAIGETAGVTVWKVSTLKK